MKTKFTSKFIMLVLSVVMITTLCASLAVFAFAAETDTPVAEFVGKQVNLGGDISMKFYVRNNEDRPIESITVEVEYLGKLTYLTECESHPTDAKVYIYTFEGINPQCLGDPMNVTILVGGSPVGHEKAMLTGYSVEKNLNEIYDDCTEAQKQLIDDLCAYGKASEVYTGHTSMTGTNYPVREVEIPATSITTTDTADDVNLNTVNVRFGTMNYLMFKFEFGSGTPTDLGDKVKIDGEAPADAYIDGNYYVVVSKPISPENFHKDVNLDYDGSKLTLSYSINDYCRTVVDGNYAEEMETLAQALYNYGLSAHIVGGKHEGGTATCAAQKVCTICGNGYGNLLDHNYTYTADDVANTITESCDKGCGHNKTITLKAPENAVYNGNAHQASVEGAIDAEYDLTYNANPVDAGSYTATLTVDDKSVSVTYTIEKGIPSVTAPTANTLTYNSEAQALVNAGSTDFGTMLYSLTENGEFTTTIPTGTNAGSYTVYYRVQGNDNVNDSAVASVTVKIAKAEVSIAAAPTPNTLTYSGEAQYLISAGEAVGGTMVYSLTENGEYTTSIPQGTNAGEYTVWYYVQGDANHKDSAKATVSVNIAKAPLTVTADAKIKSYGDENPTLTYTAEGLLGGDTLTGALTGALSREEGENAGSYAITLGTLSADNYTISFVGADFTIQAKEVTNPTVTLDQTSYQYDGNVKEPKVTSIVVDGRTLKEGIDYTVSYENNVYVGEKATVVINFMGNYDGTFRKWFKITQDPSTTEFDGEWVTIPKG